MLHKEINHKVVMTLRQNVMFSGMNDEQFDQVLSFSNLIHKQTDQMIFQQDMELTHIYYLYDGAVKLGRGTLKGDEKIIEVIFAGRTFAEGVLFAGTPTYPVTATALKPSVIISIQAKPFLKLLKSSSDLCINMLGHLSIRLHWMVRELDKQTLHNASFRIIDYFLSQVPDLDDNEFILNLTVPKRDIASRLSIKPETFSRALKSLEQKSLIEVKEKRVLLNDVSKLQSLLETEAL